MKDKEEMMRSLWIHFVYFHVHAELVKLKKRIDETLNFGLVTCIHPLETRSLIAASSLFEVTPQYLCDSFVVKYFDNGSNKRTKEEAIIMYWYVSRKCKFGRYFEFFEWNCKVTSKLF